VVKLLNYKSPALGATSPVFTAQTMPEGRNAEMRLVLGVDAAWTVAQPSRVALATEEPSGWQLRAVAASYDQFIALADRRLKVANRPIGSVPRPDALLDAAAVMAGGSVDLVAIDMPLSMEPIIGRRVSDDAVSRAYGGRKCGTHTPSTLRPGAISDTLTAKFAQCHYPLQTLKINPPGLIEVYPHPALVELTSASQRLPYKASKVRSYWPLAAVADRRALLYREWASIIIALEEMISGVSESLPALSPDAAGWERKAFEDKLDAIVCAWVAVCALDGRASPFGNHSSAIWIPSLAASDRPR
jgi:predicted RNase H-like nuclease